MQLLLNASAKPGMADGSLCVLGAGNCNDLDLIRLASEFQRVTLVDLDREAMEFGVAHQDGPGTIEIVCCDVTSDELPAQTFDVVASTCLLTQLFADFDSSVSAEKYAKTRRRHFLTMLKLMNTAATGIFITDVVSSDTVPDLAGLDSNQIKAGIPKWIHDRNFFTGTNPGVIHHLLTSDDEVASRVSDVKPIDPWLWNPGPRTYVCYGMQFTRR